MWICINYNIIQVKDSCFYRIVSYAMLLGWNKENSYVYNSQKTKVGKMLTLAPERYTAEFGIDAT